jgi:hypothetical protein
MPLIHRDDAEAAGAVVLVCIRCLWRWARHGDHDPISCPKCRTTYWNRERSRDFDLRGGARRRLRRTPLRLKVRHCETLDETLREGAGDAPQEQVDRPETGV